MHREAETSYQQQNDEQSHARQHSDSLQVGTCVWLLNFHRLIGRYERCAKQLLRGRRSSACWWILLRQCNRGIEARRFRRRVEREVQVHICRFLFAQVIKHWHPAAVQRWRRAHENRHTVSDFLNELWPALARRKGVQRWDRPVQNLLVTGVRS